jgi:glyoxylase-like metal-dependent hydrolase (beta-lactamase superfamily II)
MVDAKQPGQPTMVFDHHAHVYLGGKNVELYHFGRSHTNGDVVVLFPAQRTLAAGDMFTFGDATPELIDYPGGGSAKEWTSTLDSALQLDFDNVVPGHGNVTTKAEMRKFRDSTLRFRNRVHELVGQKKSRADIEKVMRSEFHWADLHVMLSLDGAIAEMHKTYKLELKLTTSFHIVTCATCTCDQNSPKSIRRPIATSLIMLAVPCSGCWRIGPSGQRSS